MNRLFLAHLADADAGLEVREEAGPGRHLQQRGHHDEGGGGHAANAGKDLVHIYRRVRKKGQFDRKKGFSKRLEMHFVAFRQVFFYYYAIFNFMNIFIMNSEIL